MFNVSLNKYITLFVNFLSLKIQEASASKVLTKSCPQGDIHSPFLWNISFNGIFDIDIEGDVQAFADDSSLIFVSDEYKALEQTANKGS